LNSQTLFDEAVSKDGDTRRKAGQFARMETRGLRAKNPQLRKVEAFGRAKFATIPVLPRR
jgi:hypothetical protein